MRQISGFLQTLFVLAMTAIITNSCSKTGAQEAKNLSLSATIQPQLIQPMTATIPLSKANRMINSYLNGIDYTRNTAREHAFFCEADSLRHYLENPQIRQFKLILAHNMAYINSGKEGQQPDENDQALTIIIVGVDSANNYVLTDEGGVYDRMNPCPDNCPPTGSAGFDNIY